MYHFEHQLGVDMLSSSTSHCFLGFVVPVCQHQNLRWGVLISARCRGLATKYHTAAPLLPSFGRRGCWGCAENEMEGKKSACGFEVGAV